MSVCPGVDWRAVVLALAVLLHVSRARICCDQECKSENIYMHTLNVFDHKIIDRYMYMCLFV